jgi:hypothetical protein
MRTNNQERLTAETRGEQPQQEAIGMFCNALHPDYIELREVERDVQREVEHEIVNDDGTVVIVTELVTDTMTEIVEKPGSHPLGGPVQCRCLPGHSGDHAAYVFSIRTPETWPNTESDRGGMTNGHNWTEIDCAATLWALHPNDNPDNGAN